jgi:hypothetical protein
MASFGYGYSRAEVVDLATNYAVYKGIRDEDHPLSTKWYKNFMSRWPDLKIVKPRSLEIQRAKALSTECLRNYFQELNKVLEKYNLLDKPERIFNVDEKGLSTTHKAPHVIAATDSKPPAVTSGDRTLFTVLGCGNAQGQYVPPFFVFPGARMRQELLEGKSTGTSGDVTESGWSNSIIFKKYLENHLLKFLPERSAELPVLLLYDGHKSHISLELIEWAQNQHIVLFVLPAHTSHVLQPMDIGCFGPFERIFNNECHKFMRQNCSKPITKYNVCSLACKAYLLALSPGNLQSSFKRTGIYPYNPDVIDRSNVVPSQVFKVAITTSDADHTLTVQLENDGIQIDEVNTDQVNIVITEENDIEAEISNDQVHNAENTSRNFFVQKEAVLVQSQPKTNTRRYLSKVVSGKAITEKETVDKIIEHKNRGKTPQKKSASTGKQKEKVPNKLSSNKPSKEVKTGKKPQSKSARKSKRKSKSSISEETAGTSGINLSGGPIPLDSDIDSDIVEDDEPCCVCKLTGLPKELRNCVQLIFAQWGQCTFENCKHWVHLRYCCTATVLRRHDDFFCPCHSINTTENERATEE